MGMPLKDFIGEASDKLFSGLDEVVVGAIGAKDRFDTLVRLQREAAEEFADMAFGKH